MKRQRVASTSIASVGYDEPSATLEVEFVNGSVYQYYIVSPEMFGRLMSAESKGRFLNTYIRDAFPASRVG